MPAWIRLLVATALISIAWAQRADPGPDARPNPARDAQLKLLVPLTDGTREDDHPAIAHHGGRVWVAWVSYSESEHRSRIFARHLENGKWSDPEQVSEASGDFHKPAITVDARDRVWVAWPAQISGNWDIYGRIRSTNGGWSKVERWTSNP